MHWIPVFLEEGDLQTIRYWRFGPKIRKSEQDTTEYQLIRLLDGVQVLLCSDKLATSSGASVAFSVGSFDQPVYFLPHLLVSVLITVDPGRPPWTCSLSRTLCSPVCDEYRRGDWWIRHRFALKREFSQAIQHC